MTRNRFRAVVLAVALVVLSGVASPRLPPRWHPFVQAAFGALLVVLTRAPLGLRPPALWAGLRTGLGAATAVGVVTATATALPPVRAAMAHRALPARPACWLLRIPVGTVWPEEASYRGALATLGADAFGPAGGRLLQSTAFGLSHIDDARGAGQSVAGTVLVTGIAGWVFARLAERSGSLAASMLAHLAVNEAGAVATLLVRRRRSGGRLT